VAPYSQGWICASQLDCIVEGLAIGHDCRAGNYACLVSADYSGIHSAGKSEVIRVDDQSFHQRAWERQLACRPPKKKRQRNYLVPVA
jgi:hypothetical protein